MNKSRLFSAVMSIVVLCVDHPTFGQLPSDPSLDAWLLSERKVCVTKMLANISVTPEIARAAGFNGTPIKGNVIASPSGSNPNYFFHWVRDSALTMSVVSRLDAATQPNLLLKDFVAFSLVTQTTPPKNNAVFGIGEPVFNVDETVRGDNWGRPQNDGPALRAMTCIQFAETLLNSGVAEDQQYVKTNLYVAELPAKSLIKADLEYVAHHWNDECFDLWEEVSGIHFYTRMAQRRALLDGSRLATKLNDPGAAAFYVTQAKLIEAALLGHWDPQKGYIVASFQTSRPGFKSSQLDSCAVLASLHTDSDTDPFFAPDDERVIATAFKLSTVFSSQYQINSRRANSQLRALQAGIGRYPEDAYNGYGNTGYGNPWFLTTAALAELCYRVSAKWSATGQIAITPSNVSLVRAAIASDGSAVTVAPGDTIAAATDGRFAIVVGALIELGDGYLRRLKEHADQTTGSLSEEFNRDNGFMQGAVDLTWSYASVLTACEQRDKARNVVAKIRSQQPVPSK